MNWPLVLRRRYEELVSKRECLGYELDNAELSRDEAISVAARIAYRNDRLGRIVAELIVAAEHPSAEWADTSAAAIAADVRKALAAAGIDLSNQLARVEGRDGVPS